MFKENYLPYTSGADFHYRPQWTGKYYSLLRQVIKALMLDPHVEMQAAWQAVIAAGGPDKVPLAMAEFNRLPFEYDQAPDAVKALQISKKNSAYDVAATMRKWSENARANYRKAEVLAKEGR